MVLQRRRSIGISTRSSTVKVMHSDLWATDCLLRFDFPTPRQPSFQTGRPLQTLLNLLGAFLGGHRRSVRFANAMRRLLGCFCCWSSIRLAFTLLELEVGMLLGIFVADNLRRFVVHFSFPVAVAVLAAAVRPTCGRGRAARSKDAAEDWSPQESRNDDAEQH